MSEDRSREPERSVAAERFAVTLEEGLARTLIGQRHLVRSMIIALLTDGHLLVEGVPGLAKTWQ